MKIRHAAALAIVGWYLVMPPYYEMSGLIFSRSVRLEPDEARPSAPVSDRYSFHRPYKSPREQHCSIVILSEPGTESHPSDKPEPA
jgi:hypothetical protein